MNFKCILCSSDVFLSSNNMNSFVWIVDAADVARFVAVNQIFIIFGSLFSGFDVSETVKCALISSKQFSPLESSKLNFCLIHVFMDIFFLHSSFAYSFISLVVAYFQLIRNVNEIENVHYLSAKVKSVNFFPFNVTFEVTFLKVPRKISICSFLTVQITNKKMHLFHLEANGKLIDPMQIHY